MVSVMDSRSSDRYSHASRDEQVCFSQIRSEKPPNVHSLSVISSLFVTSKQVYFCLKWPQARPDSKYVFASLFHISHFKILRIGPARIVQLHALLEGLLACTTLSRSRTSVRRLD